MPLFLLALLSAIVVAVAMPFCAFGLFDLLVSI